MLRPGKLARPLALVRTVVVPERIGKRPATGLSDSVTETPPCAALFPPLSVSCTVMGGAMAAPAAALTGCCTNLSRLAVPGMLLRLNIAGVAMPEAVAVI